MKDITSHTGIVTNLKRLASSRNGNPRYSFNIGSMEVCTASDCSLGYKISNFENVLVDITVGEHYGRLTLNSLEKSVKEFSYWQTQLARIGYDKEYKASIKIFGAGAGEQTNQLSLTNEQLSKLKEFLLTIEEVKEDV